MQCRILQTLCYFLAAALFFLLFSSEARAQTCPGESPAAVTVLCGEATHVLPFAPQYGCYWMLSNPYEIIATVHQYTNDKAEIIHTLSLSTWEGDEKLEAYYRNKTPSATPAGVYTYFPTTSFDNATVTPLCGDTATVIAGATTTTTASSTNKTAACGPCSEKVGEPVQAATGEYFTDEIEDIDLGGPLPLTFSRRYATLLSAEGLVDSSLGKNWMHNFDIRLVKNLSGHGIDIVYTGGKRISFVRNGLGWGLKNPEQIVYQLRQDSDGDFWFMDPERNRVLYFDTDSGRLNKILSRNDTGLALSYSDVGRLTQVADGLGRALSFSYTSAGLLEQVSDGSRSVRYSYTEGMLTGVTDVAGNTTTYEIDGSGRYIAATVLPLGNRHHVQEYDLQGRVARQTDAYGNAYVFSYDTPADGSTTVTDPLDRTSVAVHQDSRLLTGLTDAAGNTVANTFDDSGRLTSNVNREGKASSFSFDARTGFPTAMTDVRGSSGRLSYAPQLQVFGSVSFTFYVLSRIDYPDGLHESFFHDGKGNLLWHRDRAGRIWRYTYNSRGQVLAETNPQGGTTTYTYNSDATVASKKDTDTGTVLFEYDRYRRLAKVTAPDGAVTTQTYTADGRLASSTDPNGYVSSMSYDANGNLTVQTDADGNAVKYEYDLMDRCITITDRLGNATRSAYNAMGERTRRTYADGSFYDYRYNENGQLASMTDPAGRTVQSAFDSEGRVVSEIPASGHAITYDYDNGRNKTKITDALGNFSSFTYDGMSRLLTAADPAGRTTRFDYTALGKLRTASYPLLGAAHFSWNSLGRLTRLTDLFGAAWTFSYTPMGRIAASADPLGRTTAYSYDASGRIAAITAADGGVEEYTYDAAGSITQIRHSDGTAIQKTHDRLYRLVTTNGIELAYDAEGNLVSTRANGMSFDASYDAAGKLAGLGYANKAFSVTYTYDASGQPARVEDSLTGTVVEFSYDAGNRPLRTSRPNGRATEYSWDAAGRLTRITDSGLADQQSVYNAAGEVVEKTQQLPLEVSALADAYSQTFDYDRAGQLRSAGYAYDRTGRMTAAPGRTFSWDGLSRLTATGAAVLSYNGLGSLMTRTEGDATIHYYHNNALPGAPVVAEQDAATGQFLRYYVWTPAGILLYMIDASAGNAVLHYHFDNQGSTLFLTNGSGAVTDAYAYTPYGCLIGRTGTSSQPFTFMGEYGVRMEASPSLYQMGARYYDAAAGRFLSRDPLWPDTTRWAGLNPYLYARANPVRFADPDGLQGGPAGTLIKIIEKIQQISTAVEIGDQLLRSDPGKVSKLAHKKKIAWEPVEKRLEETAAKERYVIWSAAYNARLNVQIASGTVDGWRYSEVFVDPVKSQVIGYKLEYLNKVMKGIAEKDLATALEMLRQANATRLTFDQDVMDVGDAAFEFIKQLYLASKEKEFNALACAILKNFKTLENFIADQKKNNPGTGITAYPKEYWEGVGAAMKKLQKAP